MLPVKRWIYSRGFRPHSDSIFYSPSLEMIAAGNEAMRDLQEMIEASRKRVEENGNVIAAAVNEAVANTNDVVSRMMNPRVFESIVANEPRVGLPPHKHRYLITEGDDHRYVHFRCAYCNEKAKIARFVMREIVTTNPTFGLRMFGERAIYSNRSTK